MAGLQVAWLECTAEVFRNNPIPARWKLHLLVLCVRLIHQIFSLPSLAAWLALAWVVALRLRTSTDVREYV